MNNASLKVCAFALLVMLGLASCQSPKGNYPLEGIWKIERDGEGGVKIQTYFDLHQDEKGLTGEVIINDAVEIPIENVVVNDSMASFTIFWGAEFRVFPDRNMETRVLWHGKETQVTNAAKVGPDAIALPEPIALESNDDLPSNGLAQTPPMGWNSWNHFQTNVNDSLIRQIGDAMVSSGMAAAGYEYIVIDDGWEGGRDENGKIYPNTQTFPT